MDVWLILPMEWNVYSVFAAETYIQDSLRMQVGIAEPIQRRRYGVS